MDDWDCAHAQAEVLALPHRQWHPRVAVSSTLVIGRDPLNAPLLWTQPTHVFVMPETDLFSQSETLIRDVFAVINKAGQHEFQIVSKRLDRALAMSRSLTWSPNIWIGALVADDGSPERLEALRRIPAKVRFAHLRPKNHVAAIDLADLSFVIVETATRPEGLQRLEANCAATGKRMFLGPHVDGTPLIKDHAELPALAAFSPGKPPAR